MYNKEIVCSAVKSEFMRSVSIQSEMKSYVPESDLRIEAYKDGFVLISVKVNYTSVCTNERIFRLYKYDSMYKDIIYLSSFFERDSEKAFKAFEILTD